MVLQRPARPASRLRIVVVDDEVEAAELVAEAMHLPPIGVQARIFTDPLMALAHIREYPPDLVLTDYRMPLVDGVELVRRIHRYTDAPCIMVTCDPHARYKASAAGIDVVVLQQPYDVDHLMDVAADLLTRPAKAATKPGST